MPYMIISASVVLVAVSGVFIAKSFIRTKGARANPVVERLSDEENENEVTDDDHLGPVALVRFSENSSKLQDIVYGLVGDKHQIGNLRLGIPWRDALRDSSLQVQLFDLEGERILSFNIASGIGGTASTNDAGEIVRLHIIINLPGDNIPDTRLQLVEVLHTLNPDGFYDNLFTYRPASQNKVSWNRAGALVSVYTLYDGDLRYEVFDERIDSLLNERCKFICVVELL